jgi:hypothetical protein
MPLTDIAYVLEQASAACAAAGVPFSAYPMHEVAAHPAAPAVLRLFSAYPGDPALDRDRDEGLPMFEPLSTTGVPLALRPDWAEVLATCRELGTTVVWPAVHGRGETHDRVVHRAGAYQETLLGIDGARGAGLEVGCNVFLTRENTTVAEFEALVEDLLTHGVTQLWVGSAGYLPTARSRRYEALRPTLAELLPLSERVQTLPGPHFDQAIWSDLAAHTEAAYVERALDGRWGVEPAPSASTVEELTLVCRPNLDLYWGLAGRYRRPYGNLRRDDAQALVQAAIADWGPSAPVPAVGGTHDDNVWFTLVPIPDVRDLAERYGDPASDRVHFWVGSPRYLWLDRAQRAQRAQRTE